MTDPRNAESKFRSDVLAAISRIGENVGLRLDLTEQATAVNTQAIAQLGDKIDKLTDAVTTQSQSIDRLERGLSLMIEGINSQKETLTAFMKLATMQANIISDLTKGRAG